MQYFFSFCIVGILTFLAIALDIAFHSHENRNIAENREPKTEQENISSLAQKEEVIQNIIQEIENQSSFSNIQASEEYPQPFIFGSIPVNMVEHSMEAVRKDIFISNNNTVEVLASVYFITPIDYSKFKTHIESYLANNPESKVQEVFQYGEKSFVIRLESRQKTMYLVIESHGLLLGIEYPLGENFSWHETMNGALKALFPTVQE